DERTHRVGGNRVEQTLDLAFNEFAYTLLTTGNAGCFTEVLKQLDVHGSDSVTKSEVSLSGGAHKMRAPCANVSRPRIAHAPRHTASFSSRGIHARSRQPAACLRSNPATGRGTGPGHQARRS